MQRPVEGLVDSWNRSEGLGERQVFQLRGEGLDLVAEGGEMDRGERRVHGGSRALGDVAVDSGSFVRGLGASVTLGDLGGVALVVGEESVQRPDLVEYAKFVRGVKTQVAHELANVGPVLLLHVGAPRGPRRSCGPRESA